MPATYTVRINGVDRAETHVLLDGFRINEITNGINTCSFRVGSEDASYRPVKRQTVEVEEDDGTSPVRLIFGGVIRTVREAGWGMTADGQPEILLDISADSYKTLASRRFVTEEIPAGTLKAALQVLEPYLTAYGVTLDPSQANGPTLEAIEFEVVRLDDCLNFLATLSAKYGAPFTWTISYDKILGMYQAGSIAAPWNVNESDFTTTESTFGDIEVEPTDESYANRIIMVCGSGKTVLTFDQYSGNGSQTVFGPVKFRILTTVIQGTGAPTLFGNHIGAGAVIYTVPPTPIGQGTLESLDLPGNDTIWELDTTNNTVTGRYVGGVLTPPVVGSTVQVVYEGELKFTVVAEDAAEIAANGLWEDKILAPELEDPVLAQSVAEAELERRVNTGRIVRFRTRRMPAPQPGETITITVPKRAITGNFTVTDVATENDPGNVNALYRTVTCNLNIHEQSHQTLTRWWSEKDTTGTAVPSGSFARPDLPLNSVQFNDQLQFGGAAHVLYGDLFYSQPDLFTSPPEVQSKGLVFVQNQDLGEPGHIGLDDPQRLEMGMIGGGDFSMDMFGIDASILINATGDVVITGGVPEVSPIGSPGEGLAGGVHLVGHESITERVAASSGVTGGITTNPGAIGDSFTRFERLNVIDGLCGLYQTVSTLPYTINTTSASDANEFLIFNVTANTGTIFLPTLGSGGSPNYRMFPITAVGRMIYIQNAHASGTLTIDANTVGGTTISGDNTITLASKAAVLLQRHDTNYKILGSHGTVTGGGAATATPGGSDKDVQFNDGGVFGGEGAFEWDKAIDQLKLTRDVATNYSTFKVTDTEGDDMVVAISTFSAFGASDITFGFERVNNVEVARTYAPGFFYLHNAGGSGVSPVNDAIGFSIVPGEDPGSPMAFTTGRGFEVRADGIASVYQYGGLGSGSPGMGLVIDNNTDGAGAPASLGLKNQDGTPYYEWPDADGYPHWGDFTPIEGGSPSPADSNFMTIGNAPEMRIVMKSADESVTSASYQDDDELFFSVGADEKWIVEWHIFYQSATADDIKIAFSGPSGATTRWAATGLATTAATFSGDAVFAGNAAFSDDGYSVGGAGASTPVAFTIDMSLITAGTSGNIVFRWARNTGAGTVTVLSGSYLKATKVAS